MLVLREVTALSFDAIEQLSMLRLWFSSDRLPNPYLTVDTAFFNHIVHDLAVTGLAAWAV